MVLDHGLSMNLEMDSYKKELIYFSTGKHKKVYKCFIWLEVFILVQIILTTWSDKINFFGGEINDFVPLFGFVCWKVSALGRVDVSSPFVPFPQIGFFHVGIGDLNNIANVHLQSLTVSKKPAWLHQVWANFSSKIGKVPQRQQPLRQTAFTVLQP